MAALICALVALIAGPPGRLLVLLPLLLFGPGFLVCRLLRLHLPLPCYTGPALWLGLSLSTLTLLYLWAWALGIAIGTIALASLSLLLALGITLSCWKNPPILDLSGGPWLAWGYLGILLLTLATRFVQIRDLTLPPWVDSVHHALLIRIVAEQGRIPIAPRPYLPVDELPYHWGYHVTAAALLQLSGLQIPELMLWSGQVLNTLALVAAAGLAATLWRSPLAALGAALVTGLLANMPAYYLSWGRYTQLCGMLVLPPLAMVGLLLWRRLSAPRQAGDEQRQQRGLAICSALLVAGLVLIHYRVLIYWAPLLVLTPLVYLPQAAPRRLTRSLTLYALAPVLGGALSTLPWLFLLARRVLAQYVARPAGLVGSEGYNNLNLALFWTGNNRYLFVLAAFAALWAIWRRRRAAVLVIAWVAALLLMANPGVLGLPPLWLISNDSVLIILYLPTALLLGGGLALLYRLRLRKLGPLAPRALVGGMTLLALLGAWQLRNILNPSTVLAVPGDARAIAWAERETAPDARFLVSARPWLPRVNRGGDGGWWLLPLTARWTTVPPVLYTYGSREDVEAIFALTSAVAQLDAHSADKLRQILRDHDIDYVYRSGAEGSFPAELLRQIGELRLVYEQDSVQIYQVDTRAAP